MDKFYIPPSSIQAETDLPSLSAFSRRPSNRLGIGDLIYYDKQMWRIKAKVKSKWSAAYVHTLYPCAGGMPIKHDIYPDEWIKSFIFPKKDNHITNLD